MKKNEKEPTLKLFFALWPSAAERAALAAWQPPLLKACGGRAMLPDTLHTTLAFLGEVAEHRLEALRLAAQEVSGRAFELNLTVAHYWGHNHIAYAAPDAAPPQLAELVAELEGHLCKHHFHYDKRSYKPHVTLLRNAQWSDAQLPPVPAVRWKIKDFALVRSLSDEQGVRYEVLERFPTLPTGA
jgi:2'-5' RNA ligase